MKETTKRTILRTIHIIFGLPLIGYIYGPQEEVAQYVNVHRYFLLPVLLLTGFWMWQGPRIGRLFSSKKSTETSDSK